MSAALETNDQLKSETAAIGFCKQNGRHLKVDSLLSLAGNVKGNSGASELVHIALAGCLADSKGWQ